MNKRLHLLAAISALALGAGSSVNPAAAEQFAGVDLQRCVQDTNRTEADCACDAALEQNDPKYLADFLKRYVHDGADKTACYALATTQIQPGPDNGYGS